MMAKYVHKDSLDALAAELKVRSGDDNNTQYPLTEFATQISGLSIPVERGNAAKTLKVNDTLYQLPRGIYTGGTVDVDVQTAIVSPSTIQKTVTAQNNGVLSAVSVLPIDTWQVVAGQTTVGTTRSPTRETLTIENLGFTPQGMMLMGNERRSSSSFRVLCLSSVPLDGGVYGWAIDYSSRSFATSGLDPIGVPITRATFSFEYGKVTISNIYCVDRDKGEKKCAIQTYQNAATYIIWGK